LDTPFVSPTNFEPLQDILSATFIGDNKEFRDLLSQSSIELRNGRRLKCLPELLKPYENPPYHRDIITYECLLNSIASRYLGVHNALESLGEHLQPLIDYRLEQVRLHGKYWAEKPVRAHRPPCEKVTIS